MNPLETCFKEFSEYTHSRSDEKKFVLNDEEVVFLENLAKEHGINLAEKNTQGETALHYAAYHGQIAAIHYLVDKHKLNPAEKSGQGATALHYAAYRGHIAVIDYLVEGYPLNPSGKDKNGRMMLHYAASGGWIDTFDHLVNKYKLNYDAKDNVDGLAIHHAAEKGQIEFFDHLASKYPFDPKAKMNNGCSAIHCAASGGWIDTFDHLVHVHKFTPAETDNSGRTALHCAATEGQITLFDHLVNKYQFSSVQKDHFGRTALHCAIREGQIALFDHLVSVHGFSPGEKDNPHGASPVHIAALYGQIAFINHLVRKYELDPFIEDNNGRTALYYAAEGKNINFVDALLKCYSFDLQEFITKNPNVDEEIKKRLEMAIALFTKIKISDFNEVKTILEKMNPEEKSMILNWDEGRKLLLNCISAENANLATLLVMHGAKAEEFEIEKSEESKAESIQDCMVHVKIRLNNQCGGFKKNPGVLKRVAQGAQQKGPYQVIDRQFLGESLLAFDVIADPSKFDLVEAINSVKVNNFKIENLSKAEIMATRKLGINLLSANVEYYPGNLPLVERELQFFSDLSNSMTNMLNNSLTPINGALTAVEKLRNELEKANEKQRLRNTRLPLFSAYQSDENKKRKASFDTEKKFKQRKYFRS